MSADRRASIVGDRRDELIPALRNRANELRLVAPVAEHLPDPEDVLLYHFLIHEGVGPQRLEDFVLRDDPPRVVDEVPQQVEGLRRERDALVAAPEAVIDGVEPERVELLHRCPTHGNPRIIASVTKTGPRSDRYVTS